MNQIFLIYTGISLAGWPVQIGEPSVRVNDESLDFKEKGLAYFSIKIKDLTERGEALFGLAFLGTFFCMKKGTEL